MLELRELTRFYGVIPAIRGVNASLRPGDVLGLLGPNGSGKSTTVKMLVGLLEPTSGQILYDGVNVGPHLTEFKARIGYVPEEAHLYTFFTPPEYLQFVGRLRGLFDPLVEFGRLPVQLVDRHALSVSSSRRHWHRRLAQASTPAARSVIRKNVPDIRLQKPASMVAIITNWKRRRSIRAPRSVLRMMMKGAAKTRNGTAAKAFGATPTCSNPKPAGRCTRA